MSGELIELDGSFGEGGGQILRTSLAAALLTGKGFHLANVRADRAKPGLQPQHLRSVIAATTVGQATRSSRRRSGSTDLTFVPGEVVGGSYRFDISTAGGTGLVLHTVYLPLAARGDAQPSELTPGRRHTRPHQSVVSLPRPHPQRAHLERIELWLSLRLERPGFYPRGGGVVRAHPPCQRLRRRLPRPRPLAVTGLSVARAGPHRKQRARQARYRLEASDLPAR
ncbi:MAG: RNA 3'-terminal phosphate cyclase [Gemmataceae bacterium]